MSAAGQKPLNLRDRSGRLPALKRQSLSATLAGSSSIGRRLAIVLIPVAIVLRLLYASQVELMPEETYYWNYSEHLDIGYLDHPPMVAWLIHVGTLVFGSTEIGVRSGALCCGAIAAFFVQRLTRTMFGDMASIAALVLVMVLPFFFMSGVLMTPDAPLTAAWAAALYSLERALIGGRAGAWFGAGLALGLGLLSKYTIGLLGMATVLFMLIDAPSRRWFRRWEPYAAVLLAGAVFMPVVVWNAEHHWASFAFQTARRLAEAPRFTLQRLIAGAMVLLTPVGLVAAYAVVARRAAGERGVLYLKIAVLLPISVFALFSLRHEVKLDWTGAPWTAALPLLAVPAGMPRWLRAAWAPTLSGVVMIYAVLWLYLVRGIVGLGYSPHIELLPVGWRDLAHQIDAVADEVRSRHGDRLLIVGMDRYALASELTFYAHDRARAESDTSSGHLFGLMGLMYEQWFPIASQDGRPVLLVAWNAADLADSQLGGRALGAEPVHEGLLTHDGRIVRPYFYRVVDRYRYP